MHISWHSGDKPGWYWDAEDGTAALGPYASTDEAMAGYHRVQRMIDDARAELAEEYPPHVWGSDEDGE